jgi:hypothetical protein
VWFPTAYGVQLASEWPEMRGHRPSRTVSDPTTVRLKASHTLTVTETALVFLEDARRRSDVCQPLDWIPEVHHPIGSGEALIPDALLYYRRGPADGESGSMLRALVEVDRATMGPERLHRYVPARPLRTRVGSRPRSRSATGLTGSGHGRPELRPPQTTARGCTSLCSQTLRSEVVGH